MKKIRLVYITFFILSLLSCHSWFANEIDLNTGNKSLDYGTVSGRIVDSQNIENIRSGFPMVPSNVVYRMVAERTDKVASVIEGVIDGNSKEYTIKLMTGTWNITITGYNCSDLESASNSNLIFKGTKKDILIDEEHPYYADLNIILDIQMNEEYKGTVALPIYTYDNIITQAYAKWKDNLGNDKVQTLSFTKDEATNLYKAVFSMIDDTDAVSSILPGSYEVSFEFYRNVASTSTLAYYCQDTVNIYSNMTTNQWIDSADDSEYLSVVGSGKQLYLSETLLSKFTNTAFFVSQDGSDDYIGSYYKPFKTIQHAVEMIKFYNNRGSQYSVYLLSDIEEDASTASYTSSNNYAYLNLAIPDVYLRLSVSSFGTTQRTINLNRSSTNTGIFAYCYGNNTKDVTFQSIVFRNLKIQGCYLASTNNYGVISSKDSSVKLISCSISNNGANGLSTSTSSLSSSTIYNRVTVLGNSEFIKNRYGVYSNGGEINIGGSCKINENIKDGFYTASSYSSNNLQGDVQICDNGERGIYKYAGSLLLSEKVTITGNKNCGLYSEDISNCKIKGTIVIKNNGELIQKNFVPKLVIGTGSAITSRYLIVNGVLTDKSDIGVYLENDNILSTTAEIISICKDSGNYNPMSNYLSIFSSDQNYTISNSGAYTVVGFTRGAISQTTHDNLVLIPSTTIINKRYKEIAKYSVSTYVNKEKTKVDSLRVEVYRNGIPVNLEKEESNASEIEIDLTNKAIGKYEIHATAKYTEEDSNGNAVQKDYNGNFVLNIINKAPVKGEIIDLGLVGVKYPDLQKTSMVCVIPPDTTEIIVGSDENWDSYTAGSNAYKGAFISGRNVQLGPYAIGQYEVTSQLYMEVMANESASYNKGFNFVSYLQEGENSRLRPIYALTWYDAVYFCNVLTKKYMSEEDCVYTISAIYANGSITSATVSMDISKHGFRLPTEAEWEYAARGGDTTAAAWKYAFPGVQSENTISSTSATSSNLNDYAWNKGNYSRNYYMHEVGMKNANSLGIYDLAGNVYEYTNDCTAYNSTILPVTQYDSIYTNGAGIVLNPTGDINQDYCIIRGGNFFDAPCYSLVSYRNYYKRNSYYTGTTNPYAYCGFRICQTLK